MLHNQTEFFFKKNPAIFGRPKLVGPGPGLSGARVLLQVGEENERKKLPPMPASHCRACFHSLTPAATPRPAATSLTARHSASGLGGQNNWPSHPSSPHLAPRRRRHTASLETTAMAHYPHGSGVSSGCLALTSTDRCVSSPCATPNADHRYCECITFVLSRVLTLWHRSGVARRSRSKV